MSVYGFDDSLNKVEAAEASEYDTIDNRVSSIETYNRGNSSFSTNESTSIAFADPARVIKRGNLVSLAWTFSTTANIPAYTSIATLPAAYRPMQRHYFVDSVGSKFMVTTTGYIQNVDALPINIPHVLGTSYMGVD